MVELTELHDQGLIEPESLSRQLLREWHRVALGRQRGKHDRTRVRERILAAEKADRHVRSERVVRVLGPVNRTVAEVGGGQSLERVRQVVSDWELYRLLLLLRFPLAPTPLGLLPLLIAALFTGWVSSVA